MKFGQQSLFINSVWSYCEWMWLAHFGGKRRENCITLFDSNLNILKETYLWASQNWVFFLQGDIYHRRDSIQGTDYVANYFFLNVKVSRAKIENLKWKIGGDIILLTVRKFVILLVALKFKILGKTDL